jgi:hypothetical protein
MADMDFRSMGLMERNVAASRCDGKSELRSCFVREEWLRVALITLGLSAYQTA